MRSKLIILIGLIAFLPTVLADDDTAMTSAINNYIRQHSLAFGGKEFDKRESGYTNLDGDDNPEVAVLYGIAKYNDIVWFLAIFEKVDTRRWYLVNQVCLGGRGLRHVDQFVVNDKSIHISAREFQGLDPLSSPSLKVSITISVKHGLINIKRSPKMTANRSLQPTGPAGG